MSRPWRPPIGVIAVGALTSALLIGIQLRHHFPPGRAGRFRRHLAIMRKIPTFDERSMPYVMLVEGECYRTLSHRKVPQAVISPPCALASRPRWSILLTRSEMFRKVQRWNCRKHGCGRDQARSGRQATSIFLLSIVTCIRHLLANDCSRSTVSESVTFLASHSALAACFCRYSILLMASPSDGDNLNQVASFQTGFGVGESTVNSVCQVMGRWISFQAQPPDRSDISIAGFSR